MTASRTGSLVALLVLVAGCGGSVDSGTTTDGGTTADGASDTATASDGAVSTDTRPAFDGGSSSSCGGSAGATCSPGSYCEFGDGKCPAPGSNGTCLVKPTGCPEIYAPVCGCDVKDYSNACEAHGAGVTVMSTGKCEISGPKICGGRSGGKCSSTEYCDYGPPPSACGGDDGTGVCKPRPAGCVPADGIVCGCDGRRYESVCQAASAGTGTSKLGPC